MGSETAGMCDSTTESPDQPFFDYILQYLHQTQGFDVTAYLRSSLMRGVIRRMQTIGVPSFEAYLGYLQAHNQESGALVSTLLINVTSFFRDPEVWEYVSSRIIPAIVTTSNGRPIRAWSAGSASGQEAYTLAMLLAEHMGIDAVRERVTIYATDVDEEALAEARRATYTGRTLANIPPPLAAKYFDSLGSRFAFNPDLRRSVIVGRHDLTQDAPISRIDLLLCRNTLMYFNAEAQKRLLARFYLSLNPSGYILLGRAEMLFRHGALFAPVDVKRRVFRIVSDMPSPGPSRPAGAAAGGVMTTSAASTSPLRARHHAVTVV